MTARRHLSSDDGGLPAHRLALVSSSLYYTALRPTPLSRDERAAIERAVNDLNAAAPYDDEEGLFFYPGSEPDSVLNGSTKMPRDPLRVMPTVDHWLYAITMLRRELPSADWRLTLDDLEVRWSDEDGYHFPE
ncbi:MAG: hypothetical protein QOI21_2741 [Actinomycetota bacterium]|jgi:hypothetical protein|nr:hypothetical protein [Actinomycetota bacterium]